MRYNRIGGIAFACCAATALWSNQAFAMCEDGATASCALPNGCKGVRECISGEFGQCECAGDSFKKCTTICGTPGISACDASCSPMVGARCNGKEVCNNGCDDDGVAGGENGIKCPSASGEFSTHCPGPGWHEIPYQLSIPGDLPRDQDVFANYSDNILHDWRLYANGAVTNIGLRLEAHGPSTDVRFVFGGDEFRVTPPINPATPITGVFPPQWFDFPVWQRANDIGLRFDFISDATANDTGTKIAKARVQCLGTPLSMGPATLTESIRHEGLLLGAGDTLFFDIPGSYRDTLLIWMDGVGTADFDLYVRYSYPPNYTTFLDRAITLDSSESIMMPNILPNTPVFVAVTSHSGAGSFRLRYQWISDAHRRFQNVGLTFNASTAERATLKTMILKNARRFFGATEGQLFVEHIYLHDDPPSLLGVCMCNGWPCDVCIHDTAGSTAHSRAQIVLFQDHWTSDETLSHEWGHRLLLLWDEYTAHKNLFGNTCHASDGNDSLCGHTKMARADRNFCTQDNHALDTSPAGHVCPGCANRCDCGACPTGCGVDPYESWGSSGSCDQMCTSCPTSLHANWPYIASLHGTAYTGIDEERFTPDWFDYTNHVALPIDVDDR